MAAKPRRLQKPTAEWPSRSFALRHPERERAPVSPHILVRRCRMHCRDAPSKGLAPMPTVEVRVAPADVGARVDELRHWLAARAIPSKFTSTGSSNEMVILVEFGSGDDAEAFAEEFSGSLIDAFGPIGDY